MKVLIACEESQRVCTAFRDRGHEAYSCDIKEPSGGHPEWHILGDCLKVLSGGAFKTMDGERHREKRWDLIIAHPPCTYLTMAGNRAYSLRINSADEVCRRYRERDKAIEFFVTIAQAPCDKIAIENPQGYMNRHYRKPEQTIHPWYFVDRTDDEDYHDKRTCLWLKGLPLLERTNNLPQPEPITRYIIQNGAYKGNQKQRRWVEHKHGSVERSKTVWRIAKAMANQWG